MSENRNGNLNENKTEELSGARRAVPIVLAAVAAFIAVCYMTRGAGLLGGALSSVMLGLFSYGAYAVPALLIIHAVFYADDVRRGRLLSRVIFSLIAVLVISCGDYAIAYWWAEPEFIPAELYVSGSAGGFIGSIIAFAIIKVIGYVGLVILTAAILAIYVTFFFAKRDSAARQVLLTVLGAVADGCAAIERAIKRAFEKARESRDGKRRRDEDERAAELCDDDFFAVDNGMKELSISELGIKELRDEREAEANPHLHDTVHHKSSVKEDPNGEGGKTRTSGRRVDFSYGDINRESPEPRHHDIIIEDEPAKAPKRYGEASAEDVFTGEFDPYDFATAESVLSRQSERAALASGRGGVSEMTTPISEITEADVEKMRRQAEFEQRKRELIERARREETARAEATKLREEHEAAEKDEPLAVAEPVAVPEPEVRKTVEFSFGESKPYPTARDDEGVSVTYGKPEGTPDDTEEVAAAIAERVLAENPAYARSMNPMSTVTYVRETSEPEEQTEENSETEVIDLPCERDEAVSSFTPVINEYSTEGDIKTDEPPIFKPYTPPSAEPIEERDEPHEPETLYAWRAMVNTEPTVTEDKGEQLGEYGFADEPEDDVYEAPLSPEDDRYEIFGEDEDGEADEDISPLPPEEQNPEVLKMREQFPSLFENGMMERAEDEAVAEPEITEEPEIVAEPEIVVEPEPIAVSEPAPVVINAPAPTPQPKKEEKPAKKKPDYSGYRYPPIDLLTPSEDVSDEHIQEEIQENADRLIDTLASFNVTASIKGVDRGPRITRYEVVPAKGVKVSSVMGLQDDIALNLAAESIRMEAPIPGKSAVGVEIPNKKSSTVRLRELLETEDFINSKSKTTVCMGKDVAGQPIIADIAKMPHALIAGATGMGKSVCINSLMISMLYKARPDEVKFIMIDPKQVEFTMYNGIPHLLVPIVNDVKQAAGTLMWAVEEMERRYNTLQEACVRNIDGYNEKVAANPALGEPMPRIVIVIDEFAELIMQVKNPVESLVIRIAQKARAAGIHLIIGTQKPVKEVITGLIKSNIPTKMSCKVLSNRDSILIFDQSGAEKLLDKGDMLIAFAASPKPQRVQCAFVSDGEVEAVMEHLKQFSGGDSYDESVMEDIKRAADKCTRKGGGSDDDDDDGDESGGEGYLNDRQFLDAVDVALSMGKISTSLIQRKISVGYGKAAKFIDVMEDMGIVSEPNGQKPRDVLMTKDEWREKLSRVTYD